MGVNVLELLDKELREKGKNWTIEEKVRYVYIRSCEIFTYDPRYRLYSHLRQKEKLAELSQKKLDLERVDDFRVICFSYSDYVLSRLLEELLNLNYERKRSASHAWLNCVIGNETIVLDATLADLSRVKIKLFTTGYHPFVENYPSHDRMKQVDQKIGYIKQEYRNEEIKKRSFELNLRKNLSFEERVRIKLKEFEMEIENFQNGDFFTDYYYFLDYLVINYFTSKEFDSQKEIDLLEGGTPENDIANLRIFQIDEKKMYYILEKDEGVYHFHEINEEEVEKRRQKYMFLRR